MACELAKIIWVDGKKEKVPCGDCGFCLSEKRNQWSFRLFQEMKVSHTSKFITLTYENQHIRYNDVSGLPELCLYDVQCFLKRLRKAHGRISRLPLRYYATGEYGGDTIRPHYHILLFNLDVTLFERLSDIWGKGLVHQGKCEPASIHYVTKYVINKAVEYSGREPPFSHMSKRPGIGSNYLMTHSKWHIDGMRSYSNVNGVKVGLPRYYKDRIFNQEERRVLAEENKTRMVDAQYKEMVRLSRLHSDPIAHYYERIKHASDTVNSKVNERDKI